MSSRISEKVKTEILQEYVEPCYKSDIENLIKERNFWRKVGNYFDTFSKLSIGSSSIISFASGIYSDNLLSFFSGTTSVLSLVFMQFASYSQSQSKERTSKLNKLLEKLKIDTIPDITTQSIPLTQTYQQYSSYPYSSYYSTYPTQMSSQGVSSYIQPIIQQPIVPPTIIREPSYIRPVSENKEEEKGLEKVSLVNPVVGVQSIYTSPVLDNKEDIENKSITV